MPSKKYFLALVIPEPIQSEIEFLKQQLKDNFGLKGALRSPAHITLHRPFEWKEEKEQRLIQKLSSFKFRQNFQLQLKDFAAFIPRVIYIDVASEVLLSQLYAELVSHVRKELQLMNEFDDKRGFHPHVTIAFRDLRKNQFNTVWEKFKEHKFTGSFECNQFSLLKLGTVWQDIHQFPFIK